MLALHLGLLNLESSLGQHESGVPLRNEWVGMIERRSL